MTNKSAQSGHQFANHFFIILHKIIPMFLQQNVFSGSRWLVSKFDLVFLSFVCLTDFGRVRINSFTANSVICRLTPGHRTDRSFRESIDCPPAPGSIREVSGFDDRLESAVQHALRIERHWLIHHLHQTRIFHDLLVNAVAMRP